MAYHTLRHEYMQMPPVTRAYTTACVLTTLAVQLDMVSPFQLYFNPLLILKQFQIWRLITTFLFFGNIGFNFLFNMIFTYRYCRMLEEGSFRSRTADFVMMFLFGATLMIIWAFFINLLFLGQALTIMLVYIWSRRNPYVRMNFFGVLNFQIHLYSNLLYNFFLFFSDSCELLGRFLESHILMYEKEEEKKVQITEVISTNAPYLPWVLLGFSILLGNTPWVDLMGIAVGHCYYYLEDVLPQHRANVKIIKTPQFLKHLLDPAPEEDHVPPPEFRPGGFNWGNGAEVPPGVD